MNIAIAGIGYVGLSNAILQAQHNEVVVLDIIPEKVVLLKQKKSPIEDNEIEAFLSNKQHKFGATLDKVVAYRGADFVIIVNRKTEALTDVADKVYTRDFFGSD